mmetsp:Transcript_87344/g.245169  ORF Transcript_87344/g.245169 Transcript_87344/m.245169 type:complete len:203 (+) Transcript_87344:206-814(+)
MRSDMREMAAATKAPTPSSPSTVAVGAMTRKLPPLALLPPFAAEPDPRKPQIARHPTASRQRSGLHADNFPQAVVAVHQAARPPIMTLALVPQTRSQRLGASLGSAKRSRRVFSPRSAESSPSAVCVAPPSNSRLRGQLSNAPSRASRGKRNPRRPPGAESRRCPAGTTKSRRSCVSRAPFAATNKRLTSPLRRAAKSPRPQ